MPCPLPLLEPAGVATQKLFPEDKEHRAAEAEAGGGEVPGQLFLHVEHRKGDEDGQRDDFLKDLELAEGKRGVADAVGGDLHEVFEQRDAPRNEGGDPPGLVLEIPQMGIPSERHENVRNDEQKNRAHTGHAR